MLVLDCFILHTDDPSTDPVVLWMQVGGGAIALYTIELVPQCSNSSLFLRHQGGPGASGIDIGLFYEVRHRATVLDRLFFHGRSNLSCFHLLRVSERTVHSGCRAQSDRQPVLVELERHYDIRGPAHWNRVGVLAACGR